MHTSHDQVWHRSQKDCACVEKMQNCRQHACQQNLTGSHKHEKFKTWLACEAEIQSVTSARQWWASVKQSILFVILRVMVAKALQKESGHELIELSVGHNPWWSLFMKKVIWNRESWCLEQSWLQNRGENTARVNVRQWKNWVWEKGFGSCRQKLSFRLLKDFSDTFHWWFGRLGAQIGYPHALALKLRDLWPFQLCNCALWFEQHFNPFRSRG